jgi:hypothetical protein
MKNRMMNIGAFFVAAAGLVCSAQAVVVNSNGDEDINLAETWDLPTEVTFPTDNTDANQWVVAVDGSVRFGKGGTFYGGELILNADKSLHTINDDATQTFQDIRLNGGSISSVNNMTNDAINAGVINVTLDSSFITSSNRLNRDIVFASGTLIGAAALTLDGAGRSSEANSADLGFAAGVDISGYTGTFNVLDANFTLDHTIAAEDAEFGLTVINADSYVNLNSKSVAVTSLLIDGVSQTNGTYEADGNEWLVSGSIVVVPEPSTFALLGGLLALGSVMMRRRK